MFQRMLVPLDGSRFGEQALSMALHLARTQHGALVLLHVVHAPIRSGPRLDPPMFVLELADTGRRTALRYLRKVRDRLACPDINIEMEAIEGPVPEAIVDAADLYDADSIVIASHGQTGPKRTIFGSVARQVVESAPQSVLVVHRPLELPKGSEQPRHQIAVLLAANEDLERVASSVTMLAHALSAGPHFLVLPTFLPHDARDDAAEAVANRRAAIQQRLNSCGLPATAEVTVMTSVDDTLRTVQQSDEPVACLVMVSHPHLRAAHIPTGDVTSTLFHHPPNAMLIIPTQSAEATRERRDMGS